MTDAAAVTISQQADHTFRVDVRGSGATTTHVVEVPAGLAEEVGWSEGGEADLVRASFDFLLEREPSTSILRRFSLDVIDSYFPEYRREMRNRSQLSD